MGQTEIEKILNKITFVKGIVIARKLKQTSSTICVSLRKMLKQGLVESEPYKEFNERGFMSRGKMWRLIG